eukprot:5746010-Amphidinium_carterae.1
MILGTHKRQSCTKRSDESCENRTMPKTSPHQHRMSVSTIMQDSDSEQLQTQSLTHTSCQKVTR